MRIFSLIYNSHWYKNSKYVAFTIPYQEKGIVIEYIKKSQEHHKNEYRRLIEENGIDINEQYFLAD